jgi:hypothetical protein
MTGWGFVELDSLQRDKTLSAWVQMALNFDLQAKRLRKKK